MQEGDILSAGEAEHIESIEVENAALSLELESLRAKLIGASVALPSNWTPSPDNATPQPAPALAPVRLTDSELKAIVKDTVERQWTISEVSRAIENAIHAKQTAK